MANGKTHDLFNSTLGLFVAASLIHFQFSWSHVLGFISGWMLSTLFFGPDLDIGPKKRAGVILRLLLYPYSIFSRHRGRSHWPIWGTLGRLAYLVMVSFLITFILHKSGVIRAPAQDHFWESFIWIGRHLWHQTLVGRFFLACCVGLISADLSHLFIDALSSVFKFK
jgi:uncharacterized metal-binding protein